ncbi:hypothetical protein [Streptomyces hoynatensis]|uniref:Uncharacterized protein n=1 Tax=Streptomyces hoynatensis TaxID=1141874 RepID=A0A3A9YL81_9ACTN|nr:hypothetical protein [Streptomyces hoynatensis]RKN37288.1 hypothetical protein D7294_28380 [Streptomyces hoynatensis]
MLVAAAVCPCPPLLVPEVAAGAAHELDAARAACDDALAVLAAARPERLVLVGPAERPGRGPFPAGTPGSLRGFGVDVEVTLGAAPAQAEKAAPGSGPEEAARELPPSLTVGAWLLERTAWQAAPVEGLGVGEPLDPERCAAAGRELSAGGERLALLVLGDGSACRSAKAPGAFDGRAAAFDEAVARALGAADTAALAALDADLAAELHAAGRSCWQVLAGAAAGSGLAGRLLYDEAPYGVGYFVAAWS